MDTDHIQADVDSGENNNTNANPNPPPTSGKDYYQLLGIERNSDQAAIKKAYRRMALRLHPDKTGNDPAAVERFQLVQKAYETLSDERKRTVYDTYGERGAAMFESMSEYTPFVDPDMIKAINAVFLGGSLLVALLILFPSFLSLRADGRVQWSWVAVFSPLFIVDAVFMVLIMRSQMPKPRDPREGMDDDDDDDIKAEEDASSKKTERAGKAALISYLLCFTILQILIALKLDDVITAGWSQVFIPWYIMEFAHLCIKTLSTVAEIQYNKALAAAHARRQENDPELPQLPKPLLLIIFDKFAPTLLRFAQIILLLLKLDGTLSDVSWSLILLPVWLMAAFNIISLAIWAARGKKESGKSKEKTEEFNRTLTMRIIALAIYFILFYTGAGLLVQRLSNPDQTTPSTAVILIPVFIILSILLCCFCCCLPAMFAMMRAQLKEEMMQPEDSESAHKPAGNNINMRIEDAIPKPFKSGASSSDTI
ncbi:hypothetical protein QVD99_007510 [Batrachochytrium dendrobatidis]|nr:hypothetical protein O5D80_008329 [Batrachochytrium dendrobatidis]KAK5665885.1 hypothetical protein QVD99_007510 [Batrachochytrium dendrobatidis]